VAGMIRRTPLMQGIVRLAESVQFSAATDKLSA
jgi:hypothetical protein